MPISESACGLRNSMHYPGNAGKRSRCDQAGRRNVTRSRQCGGGRIQACRRSARWRVFGRGRTEEVWQCAGRFERAVTRSCCCVMTGMAAAGFAVSSPDPTRPVNFLDFAVLTVCCRTRWGRKRRFGCASAMSASLIGHSGSSTFRLSTTTAVSMSLTGSCFSSESAPRPFHYGIRERGGTIYCAALPSD